MSIFTESAIFGAKTETFFSLCEHIEFTDTPSDEHTPKMTRIHDTKCLLCVSSSPGIVPSKLASSIISDFQLRYAKLRYTALTLAPLNNRENWKLDKTMFSNPRLLIVPTVVSVLEEQNTCLICLGQWGDDLIDRGHRCMSGYPVMLPCGHLFGLDCIAVRFNMISPTCPLCMSGFKVRDVSQNHDYLKAHATDLLQDDNLGPYAFRYFVLFCLCPLFAIVDTVMGGGPKRLVPRQIWRTCVALFEAIRLQITALIMAPHVALQYFFDVHVERVIMFVDMCMPWAWFFIGGAIGLVYVWAST
ncbi:hypothetical protein DL98DRAFT_590463 [Cadophora sp. DSE1049]|nr:hypothetical protein DL98DRAFT_590463 [Cadophora sp. DSE1049]